MTAKFLKMQARTLEHTTVDDEFIGEGPMATVDDDVIGEEHL